MYGFLLNLWVNKRIEESKVRSYVPTFITQQQADLIVATPQLTDEELGITDSVPTQTTTTQNVTPLT